MNRDVLQLLAALLYIGVGVCYLLKKLDHTIEHGDILDAFALIVAGALFGSIVLGIDAVQWLWTWAANPQGEWSTSDEIVPHDEIVS